MNRSTIEGLSRTQQPKFLHPVSKKGNEEAIKLSANLVNSAAVGVLATDGVGPLPSPRFHQWVDIYEAPTC